MIPDMNVVTANPLTPPFLFAIVAKTDIIKKYWHKTRDNKNWTFKNNQAYNSYKLTKRAKQKA